MSPVRYVRDGLKIVRVREDAPPAPAAPAVPDGHALAAEAHDLARRLHAFAVGLRYDAWRSRQTIRQPTNAKPRRSTEPPSSLSGADLRRARQQAGLSQRQLAAELSFTRSHIADCERGVRTVPESVGRWALTILRDNEASR